jgi:two-component system LytT family response regulator
MYAAFTTACRTVTAFLAFGNYFEEIMSNTSLPQSSSRIPLKADGRILFVAANRINWIESAGNYVEFVIQPQGERVLVRETLSSFEKTLDPQCFVRIHRSVIVNVARIKEMRPRYTGEYEITMLTDQHLTLSRGYRKNLKRLLQSCGRSAGEP